MVGHDSVAQVRGGVAGEESERNQNRQTKLLGNTCRPGCLLASSNSSPLHQPSSGVEVTAMMSPAWKSNSSSIDAV